MEQEGLNTLINVQHLPEAVQCVHKKVASHTDVRPTQTNELHSAGTNVQQVNFIIGYYAMV